MSAQSLLLMAFLASMDESLTAGIGKAWDVTTTHKKPSPIRFFSFAQTGQPFDVETISGIGNQPKKPRSEKKSSELSQHRREKREAEETPDLEELITKLDGMEKQEDEDRGRREVEKPMEKIGASKTIERSGVSLESWSKQPLSLEFRRRGDLDKIAQEDPVGFYRGRQAPKTDFVTSSRRYYGGGGGGGGSSRESRDSPMFRQAYDDYDSPLNFRSYDYYHHGPINSREVAYGPRRYRANRDYYYRPPMPLVPPVPPVMDMRIQPPPRAPAYVYNRYRGDLDAGDRVRPTEPMKPKRIIYYTILPEIVRKPVDTRNLPRYSGPFSTPPPSSFMDRNGSRFRPTGNNAESFPRRTSYNRHPETDPWSKRLSYYAQIQQKKDDEKSDDLIEGGGNQNEAHSWPAQVATEVNINGNERVSGRKIFGRAEDARASDAGSDQEMSGDT